MGAPHGPWPIQWECRRCGTIIPASSADESKKDDDKHEREHQAFVSKINTWAKSNGIKCTCGAASYADNRSQHSSVCAIMKKFHSQTKESAQQLVNRLLEDGPDDINPKGEIMRLPRGLADLHVEDHGSIILIRPASDEGRRWINDIASKDVQFLGDAMAVEPRYIQNVVEIAQQAGLTVVSV